ncbi:sigma-70 family RNA polymerase sigma factor [Actinospica durhamensis]|uniref:Sigma-70 family RNA polymerase sigma factor n=1 Tax=Actinospica durhamensis TaxID=1508375 RepID=A0A941EPK9_9ACTN|nr:sigma-70 family RNA polymerase sigma factor [Actinospica durhamensis]MBR7834232.1 sigma-70 family RNA polymerase sigma factor [Actinospica durhamensis]
MNLEDEFARYRAELLAHCYRMLGSIHDAEDAVQETCLRAWHGYATFEHRSSVRTWLYRIATRVCLNALAHSSRRVVPSALGAPGSDPDAIEAYAKETAWLEPFPDRLGTDPATLVGARQSLRLAVVAALQQLSPRQRAVLIFRDVLAWPAAEVAAVLETTTVAVNSTLRRARAELARHAPSEDLLSEPDEPVRRALVDRYADAFARADLAALTGLLTEDVRWEMPPIPTWFVGREAVTRLLAAKLLPGPEHRLIVRTSANGQPALAYYQRDPDGAWHAHSVQVLSVGDAGVRAVMAFHRADLFPWFGLPIDRAPLT